MPIDRTITVSLVDAAKHRLLAVHRRGDAITLETWVDGLARETPIDPGDLRELGISLQSLASERWTETGHVAEQTAATCHAATARSQAAPVSGYPPPPTTEPPYPPTHPTPPSSAPAESRYGSPADTPPRHARSSSTSSRSSFLPPYPSGARWVPSPTGELPSTPTSGRASSSSE